MKKIRCFPVLLLCTSVIFSSCGGGGGGGGTPPAAPTGVQAQPGNNQNTVSWNTVTGATSYNIYWATGSGVNKQNGTKISGVTSPYIHTGLTNGTTYYYVVTAVNAYGESAESSEVSATPTAWTVSNLYPESYAGAVKFTNLVRAPNGKFYFAFYDSSRGPMWAVSSLEDPSTLGSPQPIESPQNQNGKYGLDLSFATSADGEPSAGYRFENSEKKPVYASYSSQQWAYFPGLGPFTDAGYHTSLVRSTISGEQDDFLVYANNSDPNPAYQITITHCTPSACDLPKGFPDYQGLAFSTLAIGGSSDPVLIFFLTPGTNSSLRLLICSNMTCSATTGPVILKNGLPATSPLSHPLRSIIIDSTVYVLFSSSSSELSSLKCTAASRSDLPTHCANPENWTEGTVSSEGSGATVTWTSLSVDPTRKVPLVAYSIAYPNDRRELKFADYNGTSWNPPDLVVSGLADGSGYPAVTHYTDQSNRDFVAIVYFDAGEKKIRIAKRPIQG